MDAYKDINDLWPENLPPPTDREAIAGARLLLREGFRFHERRDLIRKWKFKIVSGCRYTWMHNGIFMINPNYRGYGGWKQIVHLISHYVHSQVSPKLGGHEMHAMTERHLAQYAIAQGFIEGRLKGKLKPEKPKPNVKDVRYQRVLERIEVWQSKAKRAENALKKLNRQKVYYEKTLTFQ